MTEYSTEIASLSETSQANVIEAIDYATATNTQGGLDVREMIADANTADYHSAQAQEFQREQSQAASTGNWDLAQEYAQKAQTALEIAADHGASDVPLIEAQTDVTQLDNARWQQRSANDNAANAAEAAAQGNVTAAAAYSSAAASSQSMADESGHAGTAGADAATSTVHEAATTEHTPDADAPQSGAAAEATPDSAAASPPEAAHETAAVPEPTDA